MDGQRHASAHVAPAPIIQEAEWAPGPVCTGKENLVPTGIRSPARQAPKAPLHSLRYPGPLSMHIPYRFVVAIKKVIALYHHHYHVVWRHVRSVFQSGLSTVPTQYVTNPVSLLSFYCM